MKIYTKTGDRGESGFFTGERVKKTNARMVVCGTLDELNSHIGLARTASPQAETARKLGLLQSMIFELGTDLATLFKGSAITRISNKQIHDLETEIDAMTAALPHLKSFIIPGGSSCAAQLHVARTVCRRAERETLHAAEETEIPQDDLIFLNRLSDYLFVLARYENSLAGFPETEWHPAP
jgi:cob(I)alamin adenosyltransferase